MRRRRRSGRVLGLSIRALAGSSPACVVHKEFQEEMKDEISKAFGIPKKYVIPILKRINGRLFTLPEKHVKIET